MSGSKKKKKKKEKCWASLSFPGSAFSTTKWAGIELKTIILLTRRRRMHNERQRKRSGGGFGGCDHVDDRPQACSRYADDEFNDAT